MHGSGDDTEAAKKAGGRAGLGGILAANVATVLLALWQGWPLAHLMWPFWIQSMIIGWYARKRILALDTYADWLGHRRSHQLNVQANTRLVHRIGTLVFLPYARVVPMHLCIVLASGTAMAASLPAVLAFSALKTAADAFMHVCEH